MASIPFNLLSQREKISLYSRVNKSVINMEAVFSDETENYVTPPEPFEGQEVVFRIRCYKNDMDEIFLCLQGKDGSRQHKMQKSGGEKDFDFYQVTIPVHKAIKYYYVLKAGERLYYYNKRGFYPDVDPSYNFTIIPGFKTPDWAKGALMYQIYVDRFYNGSKENDVVDNEYAYLGKAARFVPNWFQPVDNDDVCNFYGGDLQGVMKKLPYLQELGVEVLYFNPIFVSPSNHKYDIQDYDYVDPHLASIPYDEGEPLSLDKFHNKFAEKYISRTTDFRNLEASNQLLVQLIEEAHSYGIKIILDGVFNHCGAFNKWLDREGFYRRAGYPDGAYQAKNSKYHNFFRWYDDNWPNNDCYDCWWGHENHPKLNVEASPELYQYILDVGRKWVSPPFNADGWRLDVAADLGYSQEFNHKFWRDFRMAVKEANPQAIILAEHYGDPSSWLKGDQWDTVMNYDAFMEPITWFLTGMQKHSDDFKHDMLRNNWVFERTMRYFMARFNYSSLMTAMNQLSNHDHSRFLTRTNMRVGRLHTAGHDAASLGANKGIVKEAVTFQMTWPGAPSLYYGDEAGLAGWTDPDNRRTYPWGREDQELLSFHKLMIGLRKKYKALKTGSLEFLYSEYGLLSYGRWDSESKIAVVLNNNDYETKVNIPVWRMEAGESGAMESLVCSSAQGHDQIRELHYIRNGYITVSVPSYGSLVLKQV